MNVIYKITCIPNGNVYIGQTNSTKSRWKNHKMELNGNRHSNSRLQNCWNKYGKDNFTFEVIEECETREKTNERETYWYNFYKDKLGKEKMLNLGHTGNAHDTTKELRKRMSIYRKKHPNSGQLKKGNKIALGHKMTEEGRKKLSEERKGKHFSPRTEFTTERCKGKNNSRAYGVYQYTKDMVFIAYYETAVEASQKTKINRGSICNCRCGTKASAGGYLWFKERQD